MDSKDIFRAAKNAPRYRPSNFVCFNIMVQTHVQTFCRTLCWLLYFKNVDGEKFPLNDGKTYFLRMFFLLMNPRSQPANPCIQLANWWTLQHITTYLWHTYSLVEHLKTFFYRSLSLQHMILPHICLSSCHFRGKLFVNLTINTKDTVFFFFSLPSSKLLSRSSSCMYVFLFNTWAHGCFSIVWRTTSHHHTTLIGTCSKERRWFIVQKKIRKRKLTSRLQQ